MRKGIHLREGDILEATVVGDGILFRPMDVVDRNTAADRIAAYFSAAEPSSVDIGRTEDEIMGGPSPKLPTLAESAATVGHERCHRLQRPGVDSSD